MKYGFITIKDQLLNVTNKRTLPSILVVYYELFLVKI